MKYLYCVILLFLISSIHLHSEEFPCFSLAKDTETEIQGYGVGNDTTAVRALKNALINTMSQIKPRFMSQYPQRGFEYNLIVNPVDGELELDTSIGKPAILCNEIQNPSATQYTAYVVLSFNMSVLKDDDNVAEE